jgi:hypothetical protein
VGHGRNPFCRVLEWLDWGFLRGTYYIFHDRINLFTEALMAGL